MSNSNADVNKKEDKEEKQLGKRYNIGKTRYDLVPCYSHEQYAKVLTMGAEKYGDNNWRLGMSWNSVLASLERHLYAFKNGENIDPESGLHHMAHCAANCMFLIEYSQSFPQGDDRYIQK